jgi:hypothetical protein
MDKGALGDAGMSEEVIKQFVATAAPVIRQLERNTGRAARSSAIALGARDYGFFYSHRTIQRLLNAAELLGYIERNGIKGGYRLPSVLPQPADLRPCLRQLALPFAA